MLTQLKTLITINERGSVTVAAKQLHLTQPALTQHIRFLEHHFGHKLILRSGNGVKLTAEGERLCHHATKFLGHFATFEKVFSNDKQETQSIRFAAVDSVIASILPNAIRKLIKEAPDTLFYPKAIASNLALDEVRHGKIDFAICTLDHVPATFGQELLFREDMVVVAGKPHTHIRTVSALKNVPFILFPKISMTRHLVDHFFKSNQITPKIILETIKVSAITAFVESGMGISIVPYFSVLRDIKAQRLHLLPIKTKAQRKVGIVFNKETPLSSLALKFIDLLRKEVKE